MANGDVDVTEGSGLKVGSYTISEDAVTRHLQRVALNNSSGTELATGFLGTNGTSVLRVALATDSPGITSVGQQAKVASLPVVLATDQNTAHDSVDGDNPTKIGFKAIASQHGLTLVAANDRTDGFAGTDGIQLTRPHTNLESIVSGNANNTDGTSFEVIATGGSGVKQYLTLAIITNTSAAMVYVELKSGTTVKATLPVPATSGVIFNPPVPLPPNAANEAWNVDPSAATTTIYASMIGFKSKI